MYVKIVLSETVRASEDMAEEATGEKKTLDISGEMPAVEGVDTDEELLLGRDLTSAFIKAIKAYRFYPPENPTLKGFREQFFKKTQSS